MSYYKGDPVHGILHSADASSGVSIPIYKEGSHTAHTLTSEEYLVITSVQLVTAAGGDSYVIIGPDASLGTGETVTRGTFLANGGIVVDHLTHTGRPGEGAFVTSPSGVVDVTFTGYLGKAGDNTSVKPDWKEADQGHP